MESIKHSITKVECRVERLDKSRLKDLVKLHGAVYNSRLSPDYFGKKYDTAFTGVEDIGYIAYDRKGEPIAYYGVIPCFIEYHDEFVLAAQSADTMTHPMHRYQGLFVELAARTYDLCREKGILLVFGFPNQNSYKGLVDRLGWTVSENLYRFTIPLNSIPFEPLFEKYNWSQQIYSRFKRRALSRSETLDTGLANSVVKEGFAGVRRNGQFFQYKTYSNTTVVKLASGKAWIKIKNGLDIGDMDVAEEDFKIAINSLKRLAIRIGVTQLSFQVSPSTKLYSCFAKEAEPIPSFPVGLKNLGANIPMEKIKFTLADLDIF